MSISDTFEDPRAALARYLDRFEGWRLARAALFGALIGTSAVLVSGTQGSGWPAGFRSPTSPESQTAVTVTVTEVATERRSAAPRRPFEFTPAEQTRMPARFSVEPGGVFKIAGSIEQGASARFAAELAQAELLGGIDTVSIDSPGGSLEDAMAMARLVREKGLATEVPDGATCASSCPLILAGGIARRVGANAAIGLHQFYALGGSDTRPEQAMADAQMTTARISRLLAEFGVDPGLWLHALDTPPRSLYRLSAEELRRYGLVTEGGAAVAAGGPVESGSFIRR